MNTRYSEIHSADLDRWRQIAEALWLKQEMSEHREDELRLICQSIAEAVAQERARIDRADKIILQLTMHHHSDPDYVKGYEQAQEYFADYAVRSMIPAPFPVITDKDGNVLACVPINLKEPPK